MVTAKYFTLKNGRFMLIFVLLLSCFLPFLAFSYPGSEIYYQVIKFKCDRRSSIHKYSYFFVIEIDFCV